MTQPLMTDPAPVAAGERIALLDVLRGFSLFGILLVNFEWQQGTSPAWLATTLDVLVQESFYPLFSFLFGVGLAIQFMRAQQRGTSVAGVYLRRMLALFLIGTVHAVLIWSGDILVDYAVVGLLLIPVHRLNPRWLLALLLALTAWQFEDSRVREWYAQRFTSPERQEQTELLEAWRNQQVLAMRLHRTHAEEHGSWGENVAVRWSGYGMAMRGWVAPLDVLGTDYLLFFLLGMYAGRRRLLHEVHKHSRGFLVLAACGLTAALAGHVFQFMRLETVPEVAYAAWLAANLGVTMCHVAAIALLLTHSARAARALGLFAAPGRTGLTTYLMQSTVFTLIFAPWALAVPLLPAPAHLLGCVAFFFLIQAPFSRWWLDRYRFGPTEWVWRTLTYGRRQPLRNADMTVGLSLSGAEGPAVDSR